MIVVRIRRAVAADAEALVNIRRSAIQALGNAGMSSEQAEKWANQLAPDRISRALSENDVWVATLEMAVGWVETNRDYIAALYVSPSVAGRGFGSALLKVAETSMLEAGHDVIRLVASQNAVEFYRRRGYLTCAESDADGGWPMHKQVRIVSA